jgi:(R,R)-butanediol dehydrogenase/meso-butanediol dehydrogenase/diacetyl reductase
MQAARYYDQEDVRVEEVDEQVVGANEVRINVEAAGICGTDLNEYRTGQLATHDRTSGLIPITLGHEFAGTISEVGDGVTEFELGDSVTANPMVWCGECQYCHRGKYQYCENGGSIGLTGGGGGFAESVVVPAITAVPLPETMSIETGALVEPLAVATSAVKNSGIQVGDSVAVFGTGPIGLGVVQAARAAGASQLIVSEPQETRAEIARQSGADLVINPIETDAVERVKSESNGGVDIAFEAAGVDETFNDAIASTKRDGHMVTISVFNDVIAADPNGLRGRSVTASLGYDAGPLSRQSFGHIVSLIENGQLNPEMMVTSHISLDEIVGDGFEPLVNEQDQVKILVEP